MNDTPAGSSQPVRSSPLTDGFLDFEKPIAHMDRQLRELEQRQQAGGRDLSAEIRRIRAELLSITRKTYSRLSPWQTVQVARHPRRPLVSDYLRMIAKDFMELSGDRHFGDDRAIVTGFARLAGHKVMLVGQRKGQDTKEKIACNFGLAHPEGYRKAMLKMRLAEKFGLPVVCLIDTPGAYPGIGAEERGIAESIAVNLYEMSRLRTPIVAVVIGEGGSGGALGIGVADRLAMLEHAYYSVITPEGCAAILWRSGEAAADAADAMKLTSRELKKLSIIDEVIPEPLGGAHRDPLQAAHRLEEYLGGALRELKRVPVDKLVARRYERWRTAGAFFESPSAKKAARAAKRSTKSRTPRKKASAAAR